MYNIDHLPIDEDSVKSEVWYHHPKVPVMVNEAGTHLYDNDADKFRTTGSWSGRMVLGLISELDSKTP